jgi:hypothetical protein
MIGGRNFIYEIKRFYTVFSPRIVALLHGWYPVLADLERQNVPDFGVTWNRGALVLGGVVPPRMTRSFPQQCAVVRTQVAQQVTSLHTAIFFAVVLPCSLQRFLAVEL